MLFHVSEKPDIARFEPRWSGTPMVRRLPQGGLIGRGL